jgi:putative membrane protein
MNIATGKPDSTQLALDRTWLAHERTLMAWARTATSMISFGFTIYKFFQFEATNKSGSRGLLTPRNFAMIMICIGLVSLLFATASHRREIRQLDAHIEHHQRSIAEIVAWMIAIFGILALLAAIFRN